MVGNHFHGHILARTLEEIDYSLDVCPATDGTLIKTYLIVNKPKDLTPDFYFIYLIKNPMFFCKKYNQCIPIAERSYGNLLTKILNVKKYVEIVISHVFTITIEIIWLRC